MGSGSSSSSSSVRSRTARGRRLVGKVFFGLQQLGRGATGKEIPWLTCGHLPQQESRDLGLLAVVNDLGLAIPGIETIDQAATIGPGIEKAVVTPIAVTGCFCHDPS